jgi:hypothetical protein
MGIERAQGIILAHDFGLGFPVIHDALSLGRGLAAILGVAETLPRTLVAVNCTATV